MPTALIDWIDVGFANATNHLRATSNGGCAIVGNVEARRVVVCQRRTAAGQQNVCQSVAGRDRLTPTGVSDAKLWAVCSAELVFLLDVVADESAKFPDVVVCGSW